MRRTSKLTAASVKALAALDGRRTDYRDEVVTGLILRVSPTGARSWAVLYSLRGRDRRYTLGRVKLDELDRGLTLADARKEALAVLARVAHGEDPQGERMAQRAAPPPAPAAPALTVAGLAHQALAGLTLAPSTAKEWRRLADVEIIPRLGDRPADQLTRHEIRAWSRARAIGDPTKGVAGSPYTANRAFEALRRFYSWAVEEDILAGTPFVRLKRPAEEEESTRVLSTVELLALLEALDQLPGPYSDAVLLLLLTAGRREMVLGGLREELHLEGPNPRWVIPGGHDGRSKSGDEHVIPLTPTAVAVLQRRLAAVGRSARLFPRTRLRRQGEAPKSDGMGWSGRYVRDLRTAVGLAWAEATETPVPLKRDKKSGKDVVDKAAVRKLLPRWTIHNLRHTIATHLREDLGVRADVVSLLLGHTPEGPRVSRVYDRARLLPERRSALVAWDAWLAGLRDPERGKVLPGRFGVGGGSD